VPLNRPLVEWAEENKAGLDFLAAQYALPLAGSWRMIGSLEISSVQLSWMEKTILKARLKRAHIKTNFGDGISSDFSMFRRRPRSEQRCPGSNWMFG